MFKRKQRVTDEHELFLEAAAALSSDPAEMAAVERTTCYPQDGDAPPGGPGQPRTTVYRQAVKWNRGGYDTLN